MRSAHIGFEDAGIDDDTSVKNMAYESKMVIARPTRSPDSTGSNRVFTCNFYKCSPPFFLNLTTTLP
jgi:hypothetical protein